MMLGVLGRSAALLALAGLQLLWLSYPYLPWAHALLQLGFLALALWRPGMALIALALVGPVTTTLAALSGSPFPGARHLEVMVLAVIAGAVWHWRPGEATSTGKAALLFATIALVSAVSAYPSRLLVLGPDPHYFVRSPFWEPMYFGMLAAESVALLWATELLSRRYRWLLAGVVMAALIGYAAATVLTIRELIEPSLRSGQFPAAFWNLVATVRTHSQYDVNAAASSMVVVMVAAVGVADRRRLVWILPALILVMAGLWFTGSRVAMAALVIVALAGVACTAFPSRRVRALHVAIAVASLAVVIAAVVSLYPESRNISVSASVASRQVLVKAGLKMVAESPMTGIGVGHFHEVSDQYGAADIQPILGTTRSKDNAHNYFVQVTAELGLVGIAAFVWLLAATLGGARQFLSRPRQEQWLLLGLAGTMLTWLTGHPLLVPDAAFVFWVFAGLAAGQSDGGQSSVLRRAAVAGAVVIVIASIPWQMRLHRDRIGLEHHGRAVSQWQSEVDGQRYRVAHSGSSIFVPTGHTTTVPVRIDPVSTTPVRVSLWVDGALVNELEVGAERWTDVRLSIRPARTRFVELRFDAPPGVPLWIGRADSKVLQ